MLSTKNNKVGIWDIEYSIIEQNEQYGLEILLKEKEKIIDKKFVFPLSKNLNEVESIVKLFYDNEVFPNTVDGILEDFGYYNSI